MFPALSCVRRDKTWLPWADTALLEEVCQGTGASLGLCKGYRHGSWGEFCEDSSGPSSAASAHVKPCL